MVCDYFLTARCHLYFKRELFGNCHGFHLRGPELSLDAVSSASEKDFSRVETSYWTPFTNPI